MVMLPQICFREKSINILALYFDIARKERTKMINTNTHLMFRKDEND